MRETLAQHDDIKTDKSRVEHFLNSKGHTIILPKFYPELNPIERDWALRKNIPLAFESVSIDNIQNYHCKIRHYMFSYLEGHVAGRELEDNVAKYKKAIKSHWRVGMNQ